MEKQFTPRFLCSVAHLRDAPRPQGTEFCVLGRSNVGKSSFISHTLGQSGLAKVSKNPGKTRVANFYQVDAKTVWVDMPGYGHARVSHGEKERWSRLLRDYCTKRENLAGAIWLLDIRHPGMDIDMQAHTWLRSLGLPFLAVATKGDKLPPGKRAQHRDRFAAVFGLRAAPLVYSTSVAGSRNAFWCSFDEWRRGLAQPGRGG